MTPDIIKSENSHKPGWSYPVSPFRMLEEFFNDRAFRSMEDRRDESWTPPVDVMEKDGTLTLMASLPGMTEKEIEIKVEGQILTIRGERKSEETAGYTYHLHESRFGTFSRSITLPDSADMNGIKADYRNGILTISINQRPETKPRTIKVNT